MTSNSALRFPGMKDKWNKWNDWSDKTPMQRLARTAVVWVVTALIVSLLYLIFAAKAFAICTPAQDPNTVCPTPAAFAAKYDAGFFTKADGMPTSQIFLRPADTKDLFLDRFENFYAKVNNTWKQRLAAHAGMLRRDKHKLAYRMFASPAAKAFAKKYDSARDDPCPFTGPIGPRCMGLLEWGNLQNVAHCGSFHTQTNIQNDKSCDRFRQPGSDTSKISWDDVIYGLHMSACIAGTGGAVVTAVGSRGKAAPMAFAALAATDCTVTFWEAVGDSNLPPGGGGASWRGGGKR